MDILLILQAKLLEIITIYYFNFFAYETLKNGGIFEKTTFYMPNKFKYCQYNIDVMHNFKDLM